VSAANWPGVETGVVAAYRWLSDITASAPSATTPAMI
jgi:hypothetical protein